MSEYTIAKYIRLSVEDEKTESLSIPNQRLRLDKYINDMNIPNVNILEFVDNGQSGTNLERPAMQELLEMARKGKVDCIMIKDFSRFSRNAMDSGYFIEQVFPLYRIRFISIDDNFDSEKYKNSTGGMDIAFRFLVHEHYSSDLSKKIKSSKRIKMKSGEYIVKNAVYGYCKNSCGEWEPDEKAAEVVRKIFDMLLSGLSTSQIRDNLHADKHPTPKEYIDIKRGKDVAPKYIWTARMIRHILENEQYTGSYVSGKQRVKRIGSHSKINTDKSEWIIIPDSHPPIVSKEDFTAAQEIMARYNNYSTAKPMANLIQSETDRPHRDKMISGERLANNVIYGYSKNEYGKLDIDPVAASVIQKMYQLALQGLAVGDIKDALTKSGYTIPSDYIKLSKGYDIIPSCQWTVKCVRNTLKNIQYTGAYVSGKILKDYKTGKKYHTAKSDWIIIPNINPAIISKELFDEVQETLTNKDSKRLKPAKHLLRGNIVKCGCCQYAMSFDGSSAKTVYRCNHTLADSHADCYKMVIDEKDLNNVVLSVIRKQAEVVLKANDLSELQKTGTDDKSIITYKENIKKHLKERQQIYENFVSHIIDRETYLERKNDCSSQIEKLKLRISAFKQAEIDKQAIKNLTAIAKSVSNGSATEREVIETLVDKVFVFPDESIEIHWKISDFIITE